MPTIPFMIKRIIQSAAVIALVLQLLSCIFLGESNMPSVGF